MFLQGCVVGFLPYDMVVKDVMHHTGHCGRQWYDGVGLGYMVTGW